MIGGAVPILHMKKLRFSEIKKSKLICVVSGRAGTWPQVGWPSPFYCSASPVERSQIHSLSYQQSHWSQVWTCSGWMDSPCPYKSLRSPAVLLVWTLVYPSRQWAPLRAGSNPCHVLPTFPACCLFVAALHPSFEKLFAWGNCPELCLPKYISEHNSQAPLQRGWRHGTWGLPWKSLIQNWTPGRNRHRLLFCGLAFRVASVTRSTSGGRRDHGCSEVSSWHPAQWQLLQQQ